MRVCFVSPFPPDKGGIAQFARRLSDELTLQGHEVVEIGWRRHYPARLHPGTPEATVTPFRDRTGLTWYNPVSWIRASRSARAANVVVFSWVTPWDAVPYSVVARLAGRPCTAIVHNAEPHERMPFGRWLTRRFLSRLIGAVALSADQVEVLGTLAPTLPVQGAQHPSNVIPRLEPVAERPPLRLLLPGFIRRYKGPDLAIAACAAARSAGHDVELRIVGQAWDDIQPLLDEITRHDLEEHVTIRPVYLSEDELTDEITRSHALLLPYRTATQSGLIPLALACGRPVVITDVGGLASQVPASAASVATHVDATAIADAIGSLVVDYEAYRSATGAFDASWSDVAAAVIRSVPQRT